MQRRRLVCANVVRKPSQTGFLTFIDENRVLNATHVFWCKINKSWGNNYKSFFNRYPKKFRAKIALYLNQPFTNWILSFAALIPNFHPIKKQDFHYKLVFTNSVENSVDQDQLQADQDLHSGPELRVRNRKLFFLFLNQNICCGYSKEPSQWDGSFEHPKHMFRVLNKKIIAKIICLTGPMYTVFKTGSILNELAMSLLLSCWTRIYTFLKTLWIQISSLLTKPSDRDHTVLTSDWKYLVTTGMLQVNRIKIGGGGGGGGGSVVHKNIQHGMG